MNENALYRHELKYEISFAEYFSLAQKLKALMQTDEHSSECGRYNVYSVYFDNLDDKALMEKINGLPQREKFRIRCYNNDLSFVCLEKKIKHNDLTLKISSPLKKKEALSLAKCDNSFMQDHPSELVRELYCKMQTQRLAPRTAVSYQREAYTYPAGNVRITFDSNIRTSLFSKEFFSFSSQGIRATDQTENMILEIKYDAFLPDVISKLIQTPQIRLQAFSKYAAARRFG